MKHIAIISASVREGRLSHRTALFLHQYITEHQIASAEILDLKQYNFPLFTERLVYQQTPSEALEDFTTRFKQADGVIIVSPVYNASYPASLKNVIDLYYNEWKHKPVALTSVTAGGMAGIATLQQLQALLLKMGALVAPFMHTIVNAETTFNEKGAPAHPDQSNKYAKFLTEELGSLMR